MPEPTRLLLGCDFSSAPTPRKNIVLAIGAIHGQHVKLLKIERFTSLVGFGTWLKQPLDWVGAFDLPFGLPRPLVQALGWPLTWRECMAHYARLSRAQIRIEFSQFCNARPVGSKFAHRLTDLLAGSSPSMKWVNPPVAYMLHAGVPLLLEAGIALPGLIPGGTDNLDSDGHPKRVALEGYPGLLAREALGRRSYKSDNQANQTPERLIARKDLITSLEQGNTRLGLSLKVSNVQRDQLADDASGDALDAVLCLMQAAWAHVQSCAGDPLYGLSSSLDPLEGWIVTT